MTFYFYLLLMKHAFADLWLQSRLNKPKFGEKDKLRTPKLWLHALDHAVLTALVTLIFGGIWWAVVIGLLDFVLHALIDYVKRIYTLNVKLDMKSSKFWRVQAIDQMAHYSCYFLYVLLIL